MSQAKTYLLQDPVAIAAKVKAAGGPALDPTQADGASHCRWCDVELEHPAGADSDYDTSKAMDDRLQRNLEPRGSGAGVRAQYACGRERPNSASFCILEGGTGVDILSHCN